MISRFIPLNTILLLAIISLFTACSSVSHNTDNAHINQKVFVTHDDPMGQVQSTLDLAQQNNKLALVVLGAQWCHDSLGLVKQFQTTKMQSILQENYEITYVDVGFFQDHRNITQRFGQAHYFATPTVLIIDPKSEQLLNGDSLHKWGAADSVPKDEYISYFGSFDANNVSIAKSVAAEQQTIISQFEQLQSQRLMTAYLYLSPELEKDVNRPKGTDYDPEFVKRWREVRAFRIKLQQDIMQLYAQARLKPTAMLEIPEYQRFSWE